MSSRMPPSSFQFTPLREGRPYGASARRAVACISIHAPPRGATTRCSQIFVIRIISIHAPPRGATHADCYTRSTKQFQFTPLREGRQGGAAAGGRGQISIHAPPRGATLSERYFLGCSPLFQFTPLREGRRRGRQGRGARTSHFNSRPSARGDSGGCWRLWRLWHFNSRPSARGDVKSQTFGIEIEIFQFTPLREGRRDDDRPRRERMRISIHAPPRGATGRGESRGQCPRISIHAPPRGATWLRVFCASGTRISIHAPPRGATRPRKSCRRRRADFNSRPSARGDLPFCVLFSCFLYFNSRPSARGDLIC